MFKKISPSPVILMINLNLKKNFRIHKKKFGLMVKVIITIGFILNIFIIILKKLLIFDFIPNPLEDILILFLFISSDENFFSYPSNLANKDSFRDDFWFIKKLIKSYLNLKKLLY